MNNRNIRARRAMQAAYSDKVAIDSVTVTDLITDLLHLADLLARADETESTVAEIIEAAQSSFYEEREEA